MFSEETTRMLSLLSIVFFDFSEVLFRVPVIYLTRCKSKNEETKGEASDNRAEL